MRHKLTQRAQDEEDEQTAHRVDDEQPRPRGVQPAGSHEQAGADRAADGDHLQLSWFEAFVVALIFLSQRRRVVVDRDPLEGTLGVGTETRNSETVKVRLHKDLA